MTEHAAVIFVFFFLAEYASIVLICLLTSILFLGGYLFDFSLFYYLIENIYFFINYLFDYFFHNIEYSYFVLKHYWFLDSCIPLNTEHYFISYNVKYLSLNSILEGMQFGLNLGFKACIMIFIFIWVRASFPRIRFDQLMSFCWTILLPIVIAFIIIIPCILYSFDVIPSNITLF
jgi:NADH-ubiquinone oxidoreductase chain 1